MFWQFIIGAMFMLPLFMTNASAVTVPQTETATFAGGCFWCMEPPFEKLDGVQEVIAGYTGGHKVNPKYEEVSSDTTGHVEAVEVIFDPAKVSYEKLLDVYWRQINPTDDGGRFVDRVSSYLTGIFYHS
jgi:peptide methionine sulfoxide reductase msrA/msrB